MQEPRVLFLDIETSPILAYVWGLFDQNISLEQIHTDWHLLSWAAKWLGKKEVHYMDQSKSKDVKDDKRILHGIWNLLDEAQIIVTQNGKSFDAKKLNARFILNGFQPPSSYRHIDTLRLARKHYGFTSNKLQYMSDKLCSKYKKLKHGKFAGFDLWKECLAGNPSAWAEMQKYNKYDVLALEELYTKLIPWDSSINFNTYRHGFENVCKCGSTDFVRNGFDFQATGKYQRYKCIKCGSESKDRTNLLSKEKRMSLKK